MADLDTELDDFRSTLRDMFEKRFPEDDIRRLMDTESGFEDEFWSEIAELGLLGITIPEEFGGDGYGLSAQGAVFEEMGRALVCAPYLSTMSAVNLLLASGDSTACQKYLPGIASGEVRATIAIADVAGRLGAHGVTATPKGDEYLLSGQKSYVIDGHTADLILVVAETDRGCSAFAVGSDDPGVDSTLLPTFDRTRKQATVRFREAMGRPIGEVGGAAAVVRHAMDVNAVALSLENAGGARHCLDMAVDYASQRVQFGRSIGSFQAIKHILADLLVDVESAASAGRHVAEAAEQDTAALDQFAPLAKFFTSEAYLNAANTNIQVHGGIGFTWEHPAHLYLRRARSSALLWGDSGYHRRAFMNRSNPRSLENDDV
jgi:alkylation response protein AidB-like acyl-CoA dehydrogenase